MTPTPETLISPAAKFIIRDLDGWTNTIPVNSQCSLDATLELKCFTRNDEPVFFFERDTILYTVTSLLEGNNQVTLRALPVTCPN